MRRLLSLLLVITVITFAASCDKDADSPESAFYGTWIKGDRTGDTLHFYRKSGKNIMRSNQSFNPGVYAPAEYEYKYESGKLSILPTWSGGLMYRRIESFEWKNVGRQFEFNGFELYMFMSSSIARFTFTKVP